MPETSSTPESDEARFSRLTSQFDDALARLGQTRPFAKAPRQTQAIDIARRVMSLPNGMSAIHQRVAAMEAAGIFEGSDWEHPETLQPSLTVDTLRVGSRDSVVLECLSEIRLLSIALGEYFHSGISSEHARYYLGQVLALNLDMLFDQADSEAARLRHESLGPVVPRLFQYLVEHIGYDNIIDRLIEEVWRILAQRPIRLDTVKTMISQIAVATLTPTLSLSGGGRGSERLVSALFGPTNGCKEDPGLGIYRERLGSMDLPTLQQEALGFARAMHDTGLVSPYHATFLQEVLPREDDLLPVALGLSSTGRDGLACYPDLVRRLVEEAIFPETAQAVYGLALMLERGILYEPPVAPSLWRQIGLTLSTQAETSVAAACGTARPARVHLLAAVLSVLGQPLGLGQGNNPTCQSARAMSMWSYNDPDYLLQLITWAARDDEVAMSFEGYRLSSHALQAGLARVPPTDVDAVSAVLVPHLDRLYMEMGRLCTGRQGDPHRWINPEFHGWWVGSGIYLAVRIETGALTEYDAFVRHFYAGYHPYYNGGQPLIHPQPAGLAVTDSVGRFVGWHAITVIRVGLDPTDAMRVYFFNPNNDSGQDFGDGVVVSTQGCGERPGESSLPIAEFTSRLYLFHYDPLEKGAPYDVPAEEVAAVEAMARGSWAEKR